MFLCDTSELGQPQSFVLVVQKFKDSSGWVAECTIDVSIYKSIAVFIFQETFALDALFWPPFQCAPHGILYRDLVNKHEVLAIIFF